MAAVAPSSPFGSLSRTRILIALRLLGESYARELARTCEIRLSSAQKAMRGLEQDGLVVGRKAGRVHVFTLNPRYFALGELRSFLLRLAEADRPMQRAVTELRGRRTGRRWTS